MRLGGWAKALESVVDSTLGIDAEDAAKALESAHKEEGSILDVAVGKDQAEKLKDTTSKISKIGKDQAERLKDTTTKLGKVVKEKVSSGGTEEKVPKATPIPDDFFGDFGFLDEKTSQSKTPVKPKLSATKQEKSNDKAETTTPKSKPPLDAKPKEKPSVGATKLAVSGWDEDDSFLADPYLPKKPAQEAKKQEPESVEDKITPQLAEKASEISDPDTTLVASDSGTSNSNGQESSQQQTIQDEPTSVPSKAAENEEAKLPAPAQGEVEAMADNPPEIPEESLGQEATKSQEEKASEEPADQALEEVEHTAKATTKPIPAPEAESSSDKSLEVQALLVELRQRDAEMDQLKHALAKSGTMMQDITLEYEDKIQQMETAVQHSKNQHTDVLKELNNLKKALDSNEGLADKLKEVEEIKNQLFKEGETLMVEKQNLESQIKQARAKLKERDDELGRLKDARNVDEAKMKDYMDKLTAAGASSKSVEENMAHIRSISQETAKQLQLCEKEKANLAAKLEAMEKTAQELQDERDVAEKKARKAKIDAEEEMKRTLERERKAMDKDKTDNVEMLTDSLESMQAAMRRLETQSAAKEQRLRTEIEDLQQRCTDAEARCQELSSAVPQSTRPLLRQIESLQQSFGEKQKVWEQVEHNLRQRNSDLEAESRSARENERTAQERLKQLQDSQAGSESRISALHSENSRLSAELRVAKQELDEAKRSEQDIAAQLDVHKSSASKKGQEVSDMKAMHRRLLLEEKDKFEKEKEAWETEREDLIKSLRVLQEAKDRSDREGTSVNSDPSQAASAGFGIERSNIGTAWDKLVEPPMLSKNSTFAVQKDQANSSLQQKCLQLEQERDGLADQLARVSTINSKLEMELETAISLRQENESTKKQLMAALELLGQREEEIDDIRTTMEEQKEVFKQQLESLLTVK